MLPEFFWGVQSAQLFQRDFMVLAQAVGVTVKPFIEGGFGAACQMFPQLLDFLFQPGVDQMGFLLPFRSVQLT